MNVRKYLILALLMSGIGSLFQLWAFNNDGKPDILWYDWNTGLNKCWYMDNATEVSEVNLNGTGTTTWKMIGTGDFNNDGQLDILWYAPATQQAAVWYMQGTTFLSGAVMSNIPATTDWEVVGCGYFSGYTDKNVDLLWRSKTSGQMAVWYLDGTFHVSGTAYVNTYPNTDWKVCGVGDFNKDGYPDLLWKYYGTDPAASGEIAIWYMNGVNETTASLVTDSAGNPMLVTDNGYALVGTEDFNGDGQLDILWRYTNGYNFIWYLNNNVYSTSTTVSQLMATNWTIGGLGDSKYDGDADGMADLWEKTSFGDLDQGPYGDYDGDGITNLEEYKNGSSPSADVGLQVFNNLKN